MWSPWIWYKVSSKSILNGNRKDGMCDFRVSAAAGTQNPLTFSGFTIQFSKTNYGQQFLCRKSFLKTHTSEISRILKNWRSMTPKVMKIIDKALNEFFSVDRLGDLSSKKKHLEKSIIIIRLSYPDMKSNPYCLVCCFQLNRRSVKVMFMQIRFYILRSIRQ